MELKADLSEPCRARLLRGVGKRTRGGATDEGDVTDSVRDPGSMPSAQTTMGARATPKAFGAANRLQRRTGASSAIPAFASNAPFETAQFSWRGAPAFPYRVRRFALCCAHRVGGPPFAPSRPTHQARTGSCATCMRRAE